MNQNRYILYARKSTDVEDKQVLSIEAQLAELRGYAKDNDLIVIDTVIEKKSAKVPGRPKFGEVLKRIQNDFCSVFRGAKHFSRYIRLFI